jgi:hypothetical protein
MKTGLDALDTAENESGRAKHENGTRRPRYRRNRVMERKTSKLHPTPSIPPKMSPEVQNMITGPDASVPLKTGSRVQNMKTSHDALGTAENESGSAKYDNGTRRLGTAENGSGSAKHENETRRAKYR